MTDGTSQGLFIVLAIVIFGIFVALSYTVFGNEGLSGGMSDIFESSIHRVDKSFNKYVDVDFTLSHPSEVEGEFEVHSLTSNSIEYTSFGLHHNGIGAVLESDFLELDTEYVVTYDITKLEGTIANIGGHMHISAKQESYINGVKNPNRWLSGNVYPDTFDTYTVELHFNTEYLEISDSGTRNGTLGSRDSYAPHVSLSTNRSRDIGERGEHRVRIDNIRVQKKLGR